MRDPYQVLGVSRTASQDDIKKAYRRLAKKLHPDVNPGDRTMEQRFKEISAAYDLLGDTARRTRFERGEIDADGRDRHDTAFHRAYAEAAAASRGRGRGRGTAGGFDGGNIFDDFLARGSFKAKGADVAYVLNVGFSDAIMGGKQRLTLSNGRDLEVTIPPGTDDRDTLRLKGQGLAGMGGGGDGDALVEIRVAPHPHFSRHNQDVHLDVPITLHEAVHGAVVEVPTIDGKVALKIPAGANTGTTLRLRGKGVPDRTGGRGDQYVRLMVVLPETSEPELSDFLARWRPRGAYEPRRKLESDKPA